MPSFHKKKTKLEAEDAGYYHVSMQRQKLKKNLRLPKIIDQKDAAQVRQFLFEKAITCFNDENKNNIISFDMNPKTVEPNIIGNEFTGYVDVNRQRHFIATDYIAKDTVINEVEKALDFMKPGNVNLLDEKNKITYDASGIRIFSDTEKKNWDHATYWNNKWLNSYNVNKDNEHVIGFALIPKHDGNGEMYLPVRPNDIVFDVKNEEYFYFNENTYDINSTGFSQKSKLVSKKQRAPALERIA